MRVLVEPQPRQAPSWGVRALDRLLLSTIVLIGFVALSSYHRATTTISLTTTVSTGQGNSTTARVLLRDSSRFDSLQELTITLEQEAHPELAAQRRSNTPRLLLRYTACTGESVLRGTLQLP